MYQVECPYCEKENEVDYYESDNFDMECEWCSEEFEVTVEYDPSFGASKIEYKKCIECGKEYRYEGKSFPAPEKYKNVDLGKYHVCKICYIREAFKDLEKS